MFISGDSAFHLRFGSGTLIGWLDRQRLLLQKERGVVRTASGQIAGHRIFVYDTAMIIDIAEMCLEHRLKPLAIGVLNT